jgi:hypothetical protein
VPRSEWKLGWWERVAEFAKEAKVITRADFNKRFPHDFVSCRKHDYKEADWILSFKLTKEGASTPQWIYVDYIVKVTRNDKKAYDADYPCQAVQVSTPKHYPPPPFVMTKQFRTALHRASVAYGVNELKTLRVTRTPNSFLVAIKKEIE